MKKNITIINTVSINGGDEALLISTINGIKKRLPNVKIRFLSNNPNLSNAFFKEFEFDFDWEYAFLQRDINENFYLHKIKVIFRKFLFTVFKVEFTSPISMFFSSKREKRVYNILKNTDQVILGAGGYIHDFYGFDKRLKTCNFIKTHFNLDYHIFSQSVGPFWKKENFKDLIFFLNNAKTIVLREDLSRKHIESVGYKKKVIVSTDVAFSLYNDYKILPKNKNIKNIVICFREWNFEGKNDDLLLKAVKLCKWLIENKNMNLTFISTCQGIKGYSDDSIFAKKIVLRLDKELQKKCKIISNKFNLSELILTFSKYDAYIGMRLHGAILSMIAGLPAFNIAYEDKSLGIFNDMGFDNYSISYKEKGEKWLKFINSFLENENTIKKELSQKMNMMMNKSQENFEILIDSFNN